MSARTMTLAAALALLAPAPGESAESVRAFGDVRGGYYATEREARDGTESDADELKLRLRLGVEAALSDAWLARGRIAGRFTSEQDRTRVWIKAWAPTRTGLEDGDTTIDELFLRYAPAGGDWSLRFGRFQSKLELMGVAAKSLDRNDSPNVDITWTDGLHLQYKLTPRWQSHLVLQSNVSSGTGPAARAPLSFDDNGSRITTFGALEATAPLGPLKQRVFSVTWMPETLATDGLGADKREDYFAWTAKLFAEWPLGQSGMRFGLGGEAGYAPNTPIESAVNAGTGGSADGAAGQLSLNLLDFSPGHNIGFVAGRAGAGWLLSPDFRNNDTLLEVRYQWRITKDWSMEARIRRREEIDIPASALQERVDDDVYVRFTGRF